MLYYGFENSMKIYFLLIQILIIKKKYKTNVGYSLYVYYEHYYYYIAYANIFN